MNGNVISNGLCFFYSVFLQFVALLLNYRISFTTQMKSNPEFSVYHKIPSFVCILDQREYHFLV